ncbi:SUMF1/EgtB/PvdO family nonheme iron enzyme [bacterium]|nr:SUMF1/EgtB/PvdO family nonheme iron enzyme [bacterium]
MKEEKKISQSDIDQASVRLQPIAGVSPRAYLPAAYALAVLVVLFLVLVLPGMRKNGSYLVFEGAPATSAVYAGGAYKGSTNQAIFLPAGSYDLRIERQGFAASTLKVEVGGRILGSLLFPRRQRVAYALKADQPGAVLSAAFAEYAAWSLSGKPSALYQIPEVLSDAASALASTGAMAAALAGSGNGAAAGGAPALAFAKDVAATATSAEAARDGLKAATLASSGGMPGPLTLVQAARTAVAAIGQGRGGAVWLRDIMARSSAQGTKASPAASALAQLAAQASASAALSSSAAPRPAGSISYAGHDFVLFSAGAAAMGGEAPSGSRAGYAQELAPFGLAKTEVTNRQWAAFLAANPRWRPENRAALADEGLADDAYLATWTADSGAGPKASLPVTGVSWAAAAAYCEWLSSRSGGPWKAALPTEAMWEAAARAGLADPSSSTQKKATWSDVSASGPSPVGAAGLDAAGIADLFGNVWEWSADAYYPYPALAAGGHAGAERAVRGGSWANAPDSISLSSRGGVVSAPASEFLGFRPALVAR